jgi:hypothetical protein
MSDTSSSGAASDGGELLCECRRWHDWQEVARVGEMSGCNLSCCWPLYNRGECRCMAVRSSGMSRRYRERKTLACPSCIQLEGGISWRGREGGFLQIERGLPASYSLSHDRTRLIRNQQISTDRVYGISIQ